MSRPSPDPIASDTENWVSRLNENFEKAMDTPIAFYQATTVPALTLAYNPKLYEDCFALVGQTLYRSDGTDWVVYREQLTEIVDLNPTTATLQDVQDAYNDLIYDMQLKGWMTS